MSGGDSLRRPSTEERTASYLYVGALCFRGRGPAACPFPAGRLPGRGLSAYAEVVRGEEN
jgi:hypothetical protein